MCTTTENKAATSATTVAEGSSRVTHMLAFCGVVTVASLASTVALAFKAADNNTTTVTAETPTIIVNTGAGELIRGPPAGENPCAGKKPDLPNFDCVIDAVDNVSPQAGANVTAGYQGSLVVDHQPILDPYWKVGMCPVNVHWHRGAEHYSLGQFDETGSGPNLQGEENSRRLEDEPRTGFQCKYYDTSKEMFVKPYQWKHCVNMDVGETYEVHWPHSAAGACGTLNQYQTPFYDGVFCMDGVLTSTHEQIGVQSQVFTIVNDEAYYYPDLIKGMIVDGDKGMDIAKYTGSTTGTSRDNEVCSQYSPITWQVDRKCHMISASSFDKMCADMKAQRDDMSDDLYPHGSRELVADFIAANNQNRKLRGN